MGPVPFLVTQRNPLLHQRQHPNSNHNRRENLLLSDQPRNVAPRARERDEKLHEMQPNDVW